ncbi:glutamine synthetase family protein [Pseudonocardia xinjiangensis]|uniref:glutamine synthetase family protein n=1 Tax=Pseudonocardia xinjiangensis TaxID=75289 RepID=UPI003D92D744
MTAANFSPAISGIGRHGFVAEHGLHTADQQSAAVEVAEQIDRLGIRTVRMVVVDQHGTPRAKFLSPHAAIAGLSNGIDFSGAIYSMDSANFLFPPAFAPGGGLGIEEFTGFPDVVIVPDPTTFRALPWADSTAWILCDAYFSNGRPVPLDPRHILRTQVQRLAEENLTYVTGLEVEFYITRRVTPAIGLHDTTQPPVPLAVEPFQFGYQYLSEVRLDSVNETVTALRDGLIGIGLPPRSIEDEWGPGQLEISFSPMVGLDSADAMLLFRSAVKQICARQGLHATFMCKPPLPNFFASGWHLHASLADASGTNVFRSEENVLSETGLGYLAGQLAHAPAMAAFANPTVNGYSRLAPYSFAPDRISWAVENRGSLVRVQGGPGDPGTHLENRIGEPAANPYLFLAADLAAGRDGITRGLTPPPSVAGDPYTADAVALPATLLDAVAELDKDPLYRDEFGPEFLDSYQMMKRAEYARFEAARGGAEDPDTAAADWQLREYFEFY